MGQFREILDSWLLPIEIALAALTFYFVPRLDFVERLRIPFLSEMMIMLLTATVAFLIVIGLMETLAGRRMLK
ncbi:hypothetical protein [Halobellus limi]|uniref:hypothetical protein n=1 Tax=Halobellus limi TaxID=699433 RepID=UPI0010A3E643|nr:hypothetical protein [Halobellus limi]